MFIDARDFWFFRECLEAACERHHCRVHAYVLMTNHFHLLMTPSADAAIGKVMQSVGCRYVQYFNRTCQRTGTLWEGRYRATLVDTARYLLHCYRYIELNPVRAGLAASPSDYRWSSHGANAFGRVDPIVVPHEAYTALGRDDQSRRGAYRFLFRDPLDEATLREIREATNQGWALGSDAFRDEITSRDRRANPLPRGGARRMTSMGSDSIEIPNGV